VVLCSGAKPLITAAHLAGWLVVVVTNQSGITRGFFDRESYERVSQRMRELLGPEAPLAAIDANGWGLVAPGGSWRKPNPGMVLDAAQTLHLDLNGSVLIGDRLSDLRGHGHDVVIVGGGMVGLCLAHQLLDRGLTHQITVGIRSQLFNRSKQRLEDDFLCLPGPASTHVLNAISPAVTASFGLADLILDQAAPAKGL
jgi:HAD superfamily hydrolase (TIGR01662 family)